MSAIRLEERRCDDLRARGVLAAHVVKDTLAGPLSANTLPYTAELGWGKKLNDVLDYASRLATDMAKQRSRFEFYVPDIGKLQEQQNSGENIHIWGEVAEIADRYEFDGQITYVVVPGLRRWGDGLGLNLNRYVDLEAAQVRCIEYEVD